MASLREKMVRSRNLLAIFVFAEPMRFHVKAEQPVISFRMG